MNLTKEERDQWRERLLSSYTCFDAEHATFTIRLLRECPAYTLLYQFFPKDTGKSKVK